MCLCVRDHYSPVLKMASRLPLESFFSMLTSIASIVDPTESMAISSVLLVLSM